MKKRLWLGIIVAVLMLAITGLAVAAETPMVLDQYVTSSANPYNLEMLYFSYTPEEDGYYLFKTTNYGRIAQGTLLDDEGNTLAYGQLYNNKSLLYSLKAGETYHLWVNGVESTSAMVSRYTDRIWVLEGENYSLPSGDRTLLTADAISTTGSPLSYSWYRVNGTERVKQPCVQPSYSIPVVASECDYICEVTDGTETKEVFWEINIWDDTFRAMAVGNQDKHPESDSDSITMEVEAHCAMGVLSYQWYRSEYVEEGEESHEVRTQITGKTAASLTIGGPYTEFADYVCEVTGRRNGQVFAKQEVWFFVYPFTDFKLTAAQQNVIMTPGESLTLEVALEGNTDGVVLEWACYDAAWNYIPIEGEHGTTLTVLAPPSRYTTYECMAIREADGMSCTVSIDVEFQSLLQAGHSTNPYSETRDMDPVTMSVSATTDGGVLSYQWYQIRYDNASGYQILIPMEGANGASFVEPSVTSGVQKTYRCVVGNGYIGTSLDFYVLHSTSATYTPSFSVYPDSPSSIVVDRGGSTEMRTRTENAQGTVHYQWLQRQGRSLIPVSGVNNSSYTATDIQLETDYYCQATDSESAASGSATFHISIATPTDLQAVAASAQERTVEPEMQTELSVSVTGGMGTIQYEWYEKKYDLENEVWVTNEVNGVTGSTYTPTIDRESVFTCVVSDDMAYQQIPFTVHLDSGLTAEAATDTYRTVALHDSVTLAVSATSSQNRAIHYEWIRADSGNSESQIIEGENESSYTIRDMSASGTYTCRVSDGYTIIPIHFNLRVDNQFSISQEGEFSRSVPVGQPVTLSVNVSALDTSKIRYEWRSYNNSGVLSDTDTLTLESVTTSGYYYVNVHDEISARSSVLYYYVRADSGLVVRAEGETYLSVLAGTPVTLKVNASHLTDDDIQYTWYHYQDNPETGYPDYVVDQEGLSDTMTIADPLSGWVYCEVRDAYLRQTMDFSISVDSGLAAEAADGVTTILAEPGEPVELAVVASHDTTDEIQYQWYRNEYVAEWDGWEERMIEGATDNHFTISNPEKGEYYCRISDRYSIQTVWFNIRIDSHLTASFEQPNTVIVPINGSVTLNITAQSELSGQFTYQWNCYRYNREEGYYVNMEDVTGPAYIIENVDAEYIISVIVSDGYMDASCSISINVDSGLTAEPDGPGIFPINEGSVIMAVRAENLAADPAYRYRWLDSNWIQISETTEPSLTITDPTATSYICQVSDRYMEKTFISIWLMHLTPLPAESSIGMFCPMKKYPCGYWHGIRKMT